MSESAILVNADVIALFAMNFQMHLIWHISMAHSIRRTWPATAAAVCMNSAFTANVKSNIEINFARKCQNEMHRN